MKIAIRRGLMVFVLVAGWFALSAVANRVDAADPAVYWVSLRISAGSTEECIDPHPLIVTIKEKGSVLLNGTELRKGQLRPAISEIMKERSDKRVFVMAGAKLRYGAVLRTIGELNSNSDSRVILLTPAMQSDRCAPPIPSKWLQSDYSDARTSPVADDSKNPACKSDKRVVGACFRVRGRMSNWNGNPTSRIWIIGTKRMLGVRVDTEFPKSLAEKLGDFDDVATGDFEVCPFTKQEPGKMQIVCVAGVGDMKMSKRK